MTIAAASAFFQANELSAHLGPDIVGLLVRGAEPVRAARGARLWSCGDPADRVIWVRSGVVRIATERERGRELTLGFYARGALIGEGAVAGQPVRTSFAEVHEEAGLFVTRGPDLERWMDRQPGLARRIAALLSERRHRLETRLGALLFRDRYARLATALLDLAQDFGVRDSRGIIINLRLPHRILATWIGSTRETVSLALAELRRGGVVEADGRRVVLLDPDRLAAIADGAPTRVEPVKHPVADEATRPGGDP